jgi:FdhD protein
MTAAECQDPLEHSKRRSCLGKAGGCAVEWVTNAFMQAATKSITIRRVPTRGAARGEQDDVAVEEPLEIRVEGHSMAVVMRTPGEDRELAAGFLLTEGVIRSARDLFDITTCVAGGSNGNAVDAALTHPDTFDPVKLARHVIVSSSCGVCGRVSIDSVLKRRKPLTEETRIASRVIRALPKRLAKEQAAFQTTGGLHACALFSAVGKLEAVREDVGRHNALDKLLGQALLAGRTPLAGRIVLLSGRASFEMMQKSYAGGIAIVAAIGAPSSLAVDFARQSGQTLCGFVRPTGMNIYAGAERIV